MVERGPWSFEGCCARCGCLAANQYALDTWTATVVAWHKIELLGRLVMRIPLQFKLVF